MLHLIASISRPGVALYRALPNMVDVKEWLGTSWNFLNGISRQGIEGFNTLTIPFLTPPRFSLKKLHYSILHDAVQFHTSLLCQRLLQQLPKWTLPALPSQHSTLPTIPQAIQPTKIHKSRAMPKQTPIPTQPRSSMLARRATSPYRPATKRPQRHPR